MRSEKQRQASKINGSKSKGPTSPEGKAVTRFNGLKHGLRAEHVILPGEDPAAFEAERQAWFNDWNPPSHTRAVLVERAAVASWRLRRAVKAESAFLSERADTAAYAFDSERFNRVERALARADADPVAAVVLLELDAHGLDRLISSCGELERALEAGASGWDQPHYHMRLMLLTGHRLEENPQYLAGLPRASARLLAANNAEFAEKPCFDYGHRVVVHPLPKAERAPALEMLRRAVAEQLARLRAARSRVPDPDDLRRRAVAAAYADGTEEGKLRHRYEMAIDRSLRATIGQLMMLEKSGADLAGTDAQHIDTKDDAPSEPVQPEVVTAAAPGSLGAGEARAVPALRRPRCGARRRRPGPSRGPAGAGRRAEIHIREY